MKPLHSLERRLLEYLSKTRAVSLEEAASKTGMRLDQARRTLEWLKSKNLVITTPSSHVQISVGPEGKKAVKHGLPERRLTDLILDGGGKKRIGELAIQFRAGKDEFAAAIGYARKKNWVSAEKDSLIANQTPEISSEEDLLRRMTKYTLNMEELSREERDVVETLGYRPGYLILKEIKTVQIQSTKTGKKIDSSKKSVTEIEAITPELLTTSSWNRYSLRALDVEAASPIVSPGKKHPVQRFIDEVREIFVSLGFEEIEGPIIQPSFWNFDALFTPQDHPARDIQDTFYLNNLQVKTPANNEVVKHVSAAHENGGDTGSMGWGYRWNPTYARHVVLRTHTTAVTAKYLADHKVSEARVFSVGRVFRNEKVTFKNLVEFHQIEGIVVGKKVNLRDMMGLLSTFYHKLGLKKVKFWPSYFPYTEPSIQSMVYHDALGKWVELCGMGIFRPEVTVPLGVTNPVLAWGGGLERLVMLRYGIDDVRQLYQNDLSWLRRTPLCL